MPFSTFLKNGMKNLNKNLYRTILQAYKVFLKPFAPAGPPNSPLDALFDKLWAEKQFDLLYKSWQQLVENVFNPLLADIIQQGNLEGNMQVFFINKTIAFFWSTINCLWEASYLKEPSDFFSNKVKVTESILERILGIEEEVFKLSIAQP